MQLFVGVDWAEDHHDVCVMDTDGQVRSKGRVSNDLAGIAKIHDLIGRAIPAEFDDDPEVIVGIETDRGLLVRALVAVGYRVLAVNPLGVVTSFADPSARTCTAVSWPLAGNPVWPDA